MAATTTCFGRNRRSDGHLTLLVGVVLLPAVTGFHLNVADAKEPAEDKTLNVLFIGNSYTARHNLAQVVKAMAEAGNPGLTVKASTVIYGGRRLVDHWRLGTQNIVRLHALTEAEERATIASLEETLAKGPENGHARGALARHRKLLAELDSQRTRWDVVVLQSYRDDLEVDRSLYAEYAPKSLTLTLDGRTIARGGDFRVGSRHALEGTDTIIWVKHQSTGPVTITLDAE